MIKIGFIAFGLLLVLLLQVTFSILPGSAAPYFNNYQLIGNNIFSDGLFSVSSDSSLSQSQITEIIRISHQAYDFDIAYNQWQNRNNLFQPIYLIFISDVAHRGLTKGAKGRVTIRSEYLQDNWLYNILAHEFTHIQDYRTVGPQEHHLLPRYILEGRAWLDGFMFRRQLKIPVNKIDLRAVKYMSEITSEKARQFFEHPFEKASGYEVGGYFFVNFLRTRYAGRGFSDAQARLARAITSVGNGSSFEQTFATQFNCSLEQAQNEFCRYLDVTNGNPVQRFVGTELESIYRLAVQLNAQSLISDQENN